MPPNLRMERTGSNVAGTCERSMASILTYTGTKGDHHRGVDIVPLAELLVKLPAIL